MGKRTRRQHTVSKFYLKGFEDDSGRVRRLEIPGNASVVISANDATVIKDFYTITLPDGSQSDVFEQAFSQIEDGAADALRSIIDGAWPIVGKTREFFAAWVALQHLRSEKIRTGQRRMNAEMIRLIVGVSGKEALRRVIQEAEGRSVPDQELDREWADITKPGGPDLEPDVTQHMKTVLDLLGGTTAYLVDCHWTLFLFQRRAILTSDHPVSLVTGPDYPAWRGVGIATAELFLVPLSRRMVLTIQPRSCFERFGVRTDKVPDARFPGTTSIARSVNAETAWRAKRYVYHHPDEAPLDGVPLPTVEDAQSFTPQVGDQLIREEGLFHGLSEKDLRAMRHLGPEDGSGEGITIDDLEWPIPGRKPPA